MSRTTKFSVSLWLAVPIIVVHFELAIAGKPPANHAPVLNPDKHVFLTTENWNSGPPTGPVGTLVSTLVDFAVPAGQVDNVTDEDAGAKLGIAVMSADTNIGSWWYSINNGTNWYALGAVTITSSRLLAADANTRIYVQPNTNYYGTSIAASRFRAWDQTSGSNGELARMSKDGGTTAFSTATGVAQLMVKWLPPATTPPPVEYQLSWIDARDDYPYGSELRDINNSGVAVGQLYYTLGNRVFVSVAYRWSSIAG